MIHKAGDIEDVFFWHDKYGMPRSVDIGGIKSRPNFITDPRPHRLHFYEIIFVTEGQGELRADNDSISVQKGRILIFRPYSIRSWQAEGVDGICLAFEHDFLPPVLWEARDIDETNLFSAVNKPAYVDLPHKSFNELSSRVQMLGSDVDKDEPLVEEVLRAGTIDVLLQLERYIASNPLAFSDISAKQNPIILRFIKAVEIDFQHSHRVDFYADKIGVSERHLNHILNDTLGVSAGIYIRNRLMGEAKRLLRYSELSMQQIAYKLGYSDSAHFSKAFKKQIAMNPSVFRKNIQSK